MYKTINRWMRLLIGKGIGLQEDDPVDKALKYFEPHRKEGDDGSKHLAGGLEGEDFVRGKHDR